jgi:2-amino-4-hydroxy-6-hydroxymethyldihydropteridine diphosphokinase
MTRAYVGLGSNLGDRVAALMSALRLLDSAPGVRVVRASRAYESEPWGVSGQPLFANAVAELDVAVGPRELLEICKRVEGELGRVPGTRFGPRAIDVDVLLFGDECIDTAGLVVPHPALLERDFVVTPLLEIAATALLPDGSRATRARAVEGRVTGVLEGPLWTGDGPTLKDR